MSGKQPNENPDNGSSQGGWKMNDWPPRVSKKQKIWKKQKFQSTFYEIKDLDDMTRSGTGVVLVKINKISAKGLI